MSRGVVVAALSLAVLLACSDDTAPQARSSISSSEAASVAPARSVSPQDQAAADTLAHNFVAGLQQGSNGKITDAQAACLVKDVVGGLNSGVLAGINASEPDPSALPPAIRETLLRAFDHCLSTDVAAQLRSQFTP